MIKRLLLATILLALCLLAVPHYASAFDPFGNDCTSDTSDSVVCNTKLQKAHGQTVDPLNTTLTAITNIVAYVAGAAAIIIIVVSALKLVTSGSDVSTGSRTDTDVEDARRALANAVIGLVVIILARILILYVLDKL